MKLIKHILFFLLLLLQLSFANSFACNFSNKALGVSRIELSEKSITAFSKPDFKENYIFEHSFSEVVTCSGVSFCGGYADLVESWKILNETGIEGLAGKVNNIEIVDVFGKKYPDKIADLKKTLSEAFDADGILKSIRRFDEIPTINSTDDLIEVLENVTDVNTVAQLEQKGVKSFFRGTTRSKVDGSLFPGNPNTQLGGISTSTDPVRGTIFAIESATANPNFKGVLQMGLPTDLGDIKLIAPNGRANIELEAIMNVSADNFSSLAKVEIPIEEARRLVKEIFDIDLQSSISRQLSDDLLNTLPVSDLNKSLEFYQKAIQFSTK